MALLIPGRSMLYDNPYANATYATKVEGAGMSCVSVVLDKQSSKALTANVRSLDHGWQRRE